MDLRKWAESLSPEKLRAACAEYNRRWDIEHPGRRAELNKRWYQKNMERRREYNRTYWAANKDKINARRNKGTA